ncbi:MAG: hypothetical protein HY717_01615, partial [Planctomycetes bacterium]|nr:hypothetical protein [Planctomycetota bacterium]
VEGALIYASRIECGSDGERIPFLLSFELQLHEDLHTNSLGIFKSSVSYPDGTDKNELVGIFAYHPDIGLAYDEYSLEELAVMSPDERVMDLITGQTVRGKIIDNEDNPFFGATVTLFMHSTSGISLTGLCSLSKEDGSFIIRGVTFKNEPVLVSINYNESPVRTSRRSDFISNNNSIQNVNSLKAWSGQKWVSNEFFDSNTQIWEIGEIKIIPYYNIDKDTEKEHNSENH